MNWTAFLVAAGKAVVRLGKWILRQLARRMPNIVAGYLTCKIDHLRDKLKRAKTHMRRKWLKARITAWSWVLRWVNSLPARKAVLALAKRAEGELDRVSDNVIPIQAEQERYPAFARMMERKTKRLKRRAKRQDKRQARRAQRRAA